MEGVMLKSICRYDVLGEKPSGYFLNLENRNFMDKVITNLMDSNEMNIKTQMVF